MASITDPFSGEELFKAEPERVFGVLSNLDALAKAIPGLVSAERPDERTLKCVVKPALSFIGGSVKITLSIAKAVPPGSITLNLGSSGVGMTLDLVSTMTITPAETGQSRLQWSAQVVKMTGLVKAAPAALVRAAADKVIRDGWAELRKQIETP
ncbi:hypothetical protein PHYC_01824 [Phycisphaerales bacterium]|nr:hypothetical protein PHYC_01824 [Phycisphaerales bacterium]